MPPNILVCSPNIFDKCFRSTLFDPNTAFIRPVLLYFPVHHALSRSSVSHPPLFISPLFLLTPVIRLNLSRHYPGYHLPCHTLFFFLRHPPPPIVYPSCLSLPPRCCSSSVVGPNYHPPVLSIVLLPHATLFSTELHCLQLFLLPLPATRLSHYMYVCIPSCPSVVSFRPYVCVCPSAFLLPRLFTCLHYVYIYQSDFDY